MSPFQIPPRFPVFSKLDVPSLFAEKDLSPLPQAQQLFARLRLEGVDAHTLDNQTKLPFDQRVIVVPQQSMKTLLPLLKTISQEPPNHTPPVLTATNQEQYKLLADGYLAAGDLPTYATHNSGKLAGFIPGGGERDV